MKKIFNRIWNSPTLMTWMSYSTKALSLFVVLPLILKNFSVEEVGLWYLFSAIMVLLSIADMGFRVTFSRVISFAMGGATDINIVKNTQINNKGNIPNWTLIEDICSNMNYIYKVLSFFLLLLLITLGTWSLIKPIGLVDNQVEMWIAWVIIIIGSVLRFYGVVYQNYLEGLNKIALIRRIEAFMSLGLILTSIIVLLLKGKLLELVIVFQLWGILNVIRNWYLARLVENGKYKRFKKKPFNKKMFQKIWKPAWRSGVSSLMSNGLTQMSGVLYAQIGTPELIASYLLSLKIITQIKEVSMAPFYSKIPLMAKMRVTGEIEKLKKISQRGMLLGHITFVLGAIMVSVFSDTLLQLIDSETNFVSQDLWLLLTIAFFIHRYGAMHIQLYLTTNHVISHIADGVSGLLFIVTSFVLINKMGLYAIPIGMLVGYLGFYAWYAAYHSLRSINESFFKFEKRASLIPIAILLVFYCLKFIK